MSTSVPVGRDARPDVHATTTVPWDKRALDVLGASLALVLLLPLIVLVGGIVALTSPGPVVYRQVRWGLGGRPFTILKFRTMVEGADERIDLILTDEDQRAHLASHGKLLRDPRVTPVGRVLRRWSLDELPQLLNVLQGDMSLVGPRPRWAASELDRYGVDLPVYLSVLPGMTGPWQVSGRNALPDAERITLDLAYARTRTLGTDVRLLARTVPALLRPMERDIA